MVPFTLEFNHKLWSCSFKLSCWSWPYWERSGAEKQRRKSRQSLPSQRSTLAWWIVMMLLWPALISGSNSGASEFRCKLSPITLCSAERIRGETIAYSTSQIQESRKKMYSKSEPVRYRGGGFSKFNSQDFQIHFIFVYVCVWEGFEFYVWLFS